MSKRNKGVSTYLGQKMFRGKKRLIGKNNLAWKLGLAVKVLKGDVDVIIWPEWADNLPDCKQKITPTNVRMSDIQNDFKKIKEKTDNERKNRNL